MTEQKYPLRKHVAEEIPMKKYIVEAPEPKRGQNVSSGGIRENGKMSVQFKNPQPYKEPSNNLTVGKAPDTITSTEDAYKTSQKHQASMYICNIIWQELGEPLVRSGLRELKNIIIKKIESIGKSSPAIPYSEKPQIIDVEPEDIHIKYDNIIPFPSKKAN